MSTVPTAENFQSWGEYLSQGHSLIYDKQQGTLRLPTGKERILSKIPSWRRAKEQEVFDFATEQLRNHFIEGTARPNAGIAVRNSLKNFGTVLRDRAVVRRSSLKEAAVLERWLVGIDNASIFRPQIPSRAPSEKLSYVIEENLKFFKIKEDGKRENERLLGISDVFAKANPDFVEFALKSDLYGQMKRTGYDTEIGARIEEEKNGTVFLRTATFAKEATHLTLNDHCILQKKQSWQTLREKLFQRNPADYNLSHYHMTQWGITFEDNYKWNHLKPIARITPPEHPCLQINTYLPGRKMLPALFGDQGHSGMVFVDKKGYVYSMGYFSHPDSEFFKGLKTMRSVLRSPDRYEHRVDASWQEITNRRRNGQREPAPVRWNEGILQLDFQNDNEPSVYGILQASKNSKDPLVGERRTLLETQLEEGDTETAIQETAELLFNGLTEKEKSKACLTAEDKFNALMERAEALQKLTKEANENNDYSNGALPYMMMEQNCSHVARYYFGRWAEVALGAVKNKDVLNTRPTKNDVAENQPNVSRSPLSRWKWAITALKTSVIHLMSRCATLMPFLATGVFGRGQAEAEVNIAPRSSFLSCLKNFLKTPVTPQGVREEAMETHVPTPSWTYKVLTWFRDPSGLSPVFPQ